MNQITLIFIVFLRVKTKGHGFQMNRVYDFMRGEKIRVYTHAMQGKHACIHLYRHKYKRVVCIQRTAQFEK